MDPMQTPTQPPSSSPEEPNSPQISQSTPPQPQPQQFDMPSSIEQSSAAPSDQPVASVTTMDAQPQNPSPIVQPQFAPEQPVSVQPSFEQPPQSQPPIQPTANPFGQQPPMDQTSTVNNQPTFTQPQVSMPTPPASKGKRFILPIIIIVAVVILAVGGYFAYNFISSKVQKVVTTNSTDQVAQSTKSSTPDINTLKSFTMLAPDASKTQGMISGQSGQTTSLVSADGSCTIIYGIETQTQLPGTDIGDVISQYLAKIKQTSPHVVVNGPNKATALVLSGTDGKSYSLPTVNFTYTDPTQSGSANGIYSVSQLSGGNHAVVASICGSETTKNPADLQSQVDTLEAAAATIKVQVQ